MTRVIELIHQLFETMSARIRTFNKIWCWAHIHTIINLAPQDTHDTIYKWSREYGKPFRRNNGLMTVTSR